MIEIDARGFSCPIPVVKTKQAIENNPGKTLTIIVETTVAKENVSRFAASKQYSVKVENTAAEEFRILLTPAV